MRLPSQLPSARTIYAAFLHIAVIVLGVEVFFLARQNRELRSMAEPPQAVRVGDRFPLGTLQQVSGDADIDTTRPMLLFLFSAKCGVCEKSLPGWNELYRNLNPDSFQVAGIALDSLQATHRFVIDRGLVYPVFVPDMPASFASVTSVRFVPQTVLRKPDGMVAHS
jgi:peroxiredoxin